MNRYIKKNKGWSMLVVFLLVVKVAVGQQNVVSVNAAEANILSIKIFTDILQSILVIVFIMDSMLGIPIKLFPIRKV